MPAGRPTTYSDETSAEICAQIAEGKSLRSICKQPQMPDLRTVFRWLEKHEEFRQQYAQAMLSRTDTLAEEILEIADNPQLGQVTKTSSDGKNEVKEGDMTEHRKLQIDARKWIAARMNPRKYGDKLEQTHKGDPAAPIVISNTVAKW